MTKKTKQNKTKQNKTTTTKKQTREKKEHACLIDRRHKITNIKERTIAISWSNVLKQ